MQWSKILFKNIKILFKNIKKLVRVFNKEHNNVSLVSTFSGGEIFDATVSQNQVLELKNIESDMVIEELKSSNINGSLGLFLDGSETDKLDGGAIVGDRGLSWG